jgi:hypothetical protein
MGKVGHLVIFGTLLLSCLAAASAQAQTGPKVGLRAGVGTDVNLGVAYGVGANYLLSLPQNSLELGVILFGGSFDETTDEGMHTYEETTDLIVFGLMANYLIGYTPNQPSTFFMVGFGLASINIEWEERSDTDVSLGPLLPGGGSMQSEEGSAGGTVLNLGFGHSFTGGFDVRAEFPVIVRFSAPGEASSVIPTLIVTAGLRF